MNNIHERVRIDHFVGRVPVQGQILWIRFIKLLHGFNGNGSLIGKKFVFEIIENSLFEFVGKFLDGLRNDESSAAHRIVAADVIGTKPGIGTVNEFVLFVTEHANQFFFQGKLGGLFVGVTG